MNRRANKVQTFLTDVVWADSAKNLDNKRLNKQILECGQILGVLRPDLYWILFPNGKGPSKGWRNHPAVKMWKGHEYWLAVYARLHAWEKEERTNKRHVLSDRFVECLHVLHGGYVDDVLNSYPDWTRREDVINSHRSNLLRKDKEFYSKFGWDVPDNLEYVWPSKEKEN